MEGAGGVLTPKILGPHLGMTVLRTWQGSVEIAIRAAVVVSNCYLFAKATCDVAKIRQMSTSVV